MKKQIKLLFTLLCFLYFYSNNSILLAQVTAIPDINFERALVNQGIDSDGLINGQISNTDASRVRVLRVNSDSIHDLTGIQAFTSLEELNCNNNQLTTLSISINTLLKLSCTYNSLTSLNLSGCTNLTELYCNNNQLTTLNLSNTPSIEVFNCISNQLIALNFNNNLNLKQVSCDFNQLTALNFNNNLDLKDISCGYNQLTTLSISNNLNLTNLSCHHNQLTSLNLTNNPDVTNLNCYQNQLSTLILNPNSKFVDCSYNQLTTLNTINKPDLLYLYCHHNLLTALDVTSNINLGLLFCAHNLLTALDVTQNLNLIDLDCQSNQLTDLDVSNNTLQSLYCSDNQLHYINLKKNPRLTYPSFANRIYYLTLDNNISNMSICVDDPVMANNDTLWIKDSTATYTDICKNTTLVGLVKIDQNNNCILDSTEVGISNTILSIKKGNSTIYKTSNTIGRYTTELDTGSYTISLTSSNPYTAPCPNTQTTVIDSLSDMDTVNWSLQVTHYCPFMTATLSAPFLRATGGGSNYTVNYCNQGTAPAYDAYVEVTIDSSLNVLGTSLPIWNQVGNVYTFDLDTVHIGQCGSFTINVIADTTASPGTIICNEVHIYPDSLCNNTWNGPIIQTSGSCQVDTVSFRIENVGSNMITPLQYIVIEDNIIMRNDTFKLTNNGSQTVNVNTLPGKTYRIEAEQAPNFPSILGSPFAYSNVVGCVAGPASTVNILQYYNGNTAPWIDVDCQPLRAALDPNDKTPQPVGYGPQHYITTPTPIKYRVRFQNTGNDTAFNVVVLDTISTHLDIATLKMQAASDDYTWSLTSGNALRVNFPNIKLVDSTTNEPLSHGFFNYEITPKSNLPLETRIENTAAIYFDYNPPIFTNTTFHTIGEDFIPKIILEVTTVVDDHIQIHAYPNPFDQMTTIAVEGEIFETLDVIVTDVTGRILQTKQVQHQNQIQLHRDNLLQGIYLYQIKGNGRLVGTGKLIVK